MAFCCYFCKALFTREALFENHIRSHVQYSPKPYKTLEERRKRFSFWLWSLCAKISCTSSEQETFQEKIMDSCYKHICNSGCEWCDRIGRKDCCTGVSGALEHSVSNHLNGYLEIEDSDSGFSRSYKVYEVCNTVADRGGYNTGCMCPKCLRIQYRNSRNDLERLRKALEIKVEIKVKKCDLEKEGLIAVIRQLSPEGQHDTTQMVKEGSSPGKQSRLRRWLSSAFQRSCS
jgi:hypothetical protein